MTIWKESEIAQLTHNWRKYTSADSHREFEKSAMQNQKGAVQELKGAIQENKSALNEIKAQ